MVDVDYSELRESEQRKLVLEKLDTIIGVLTQMAVNQSTFDTALAALVTVAQNVDAGVQGIATSASNLATVAGNIQTALTQFITDYNAKTGVDLTNELASVTAMTNTLTNDATSVASAATSVGGSASSLQTAAADIVAADPNA
jgi:pyruvate/oxaloacetate carboxyltransferase